MLLKTIAVMVLIYLLVKVIARLFLPKSARRNARVIFRTFQNLNQQMNEQQKRGDASPNAGGGRPRGGGSHFDEIEEAEYEEIDEDEDSQTSKSSKS